MQNFYGEGRDKKYEFTETLFKCKIRFFLTRIRVRVRISRISHPQWEEVPLPTPHPSPPQPSLLDSPLRPIENFNQM